MALNAFRFAPCDKLISAPGGELSLLLPCIVALSMLFPIYELQSSTNLTEWQPVGERKQGKTGETDEWLTTVIPAASSAAFYRVRVLLEEQKAKASSSGGAEVFGYEPVFTAELARIGQISPRQFAELFPASTHYLPRIDFDPSTARYWDDFVNTPPMGFFAKEDQRRYDFRLNAAEVEVFKRNGFVVSERLGSASFAEHYYRLWTDDLPVFISTDAILQAWHRTYDAMLEEIEATFLFENLSQMLAGMRSQILGAKIQATNNVLEECVRDADYMLAVAQSLLHGSAHTASLLGQQQRVNDTLVAIAAEQLDECFMLFGTNRAVDFSQFKVRGHYANTPQLGRYFKCMMWLSRIDFRIAGGPYRDSLCTRPHPAPLRELGTAIVLHHLLCQSQQFDRWLQLDRVIQTFVGWTDSTTFAQFGDILAAAKIHSLGDVRDLTVLSKLQSDIEDSQYGFQNIRGDYYISPLGPAHLKLPRSFTILGQKFVMDSWALSKVVYDSIRWDTNGIPEEEDKLQRRVPSCLDVAFSVLGNDQVVPILMERLLDTSDYRHMWRDGLPYQHNLAATRRVIELQHASAWTNSIYTDWLGTLRELSKPVADDLSYPQAFRSHAWAMKSLNTQMASWSQLRRDTLLYTKQSYTAVYICDFPEAFIEPHPTFWFRLAAMGRRTAQLLSRLSMAGSVELDVPDHQIPSYEPSSLPFRSKRVYLHEIQSMQMAHLNRFAETVERLGRLAESQLNNLPHHPDDREFLRSLIQRPGVCGGQAMFDGWYPLLFYRNVYWQDLEGLSDSFHQDSGADKPDQIVADVHTDPPSPEIGDPGSVLHQGLGPVNLLMIAVNLGTNRFICAGPVLSHFEFELIGAPRRLSDLEWRGALSGDSPIAPPLYPLWRPASSNLWLKNMVPPPPPWTCDYLVPDHI